MVNQVTLVGRIEEFKDMVYQDGVDKFVDVAIKLDDIKNKDREEDSKHYHFITCRLYNGIAENTIKYCKSGDLIGIRGRLEVRAVLDNDSKNMNFETMVIAEKVTFLSSNKELLKDRKD